VLLAIKGRFLFDQLEEMQEKNYLLCGAVDGFRIYSQSLNYSAHSSKKTFFPVKQAQSQNLSY